jgi:hypothetical protein
MHIYSPFYWLILKKTILFSGFKNPYKKYAKQENSILLMNSIFRTEKWGEAKTRVWEDSSLCSEITTKNAVQEFNLLWKYCKETIGIEFFCNLGHQIQSGNMKSYFAAKIVFWCLNGQSPLTA